jgi:hypothetical protein
MSRKMPTLRAGYVVPLSLLLKKGACHILDRSDACDGVMCASCLCSVDSREFDPEVHLADWEIDYDK